MSDTVSMSLVRWDRVLTELETAKADRDRLAAENAAMKAHMEALRQQTCPCYLYTDPDCPYLASAGPPQEITDRDVADASDISDPLPPVPSPGRRCTCNWPPRYDNPACPKHGR